MAIVILNGPVRSGKTTRLHRWLQNLPEKAAGILSPDFEGMKVLQDVETGEIFRFEIGLDEQPRGDLVQFGRFRFDGAAFSRAREVLLSARAKHPRWLIVDEVGPLELRGRGFEPALGQLVEFYRNPEQGEKLLLVVRESLLERILRHYRISEYASFEEYAK